jgi:hypothetical protein
MLKYASKYLKHVKIPAQLSHENCHFSLWMAEKRFQMGCVENQRAKFSQIRVIKNTGCLTLEGIKSKGLSLESS